MWKILRRAVGEDPDSRRDRVATGPRFPYALHQRGCRVGATGPWVRGSHYARNPAVAGRTQNPGRLAVRPVGQPGTPARRDHQTLRSDYEVGRDRSQRNPRSKNTTASRCSARWCVRSKHLVLDPQADRQSGGNQIRGVRHEDRRERHRAHVSGRVRIGERHRNSAHRSRAAT